MIQLSDVEFDRNGLEVLHTDDCLSLLASTPVGRLGLCEGTLPVILPVNFVLACPPGCTDPVIIIRTVPGAKLHAAVDGRPLAFEIDSYDAFDHSGWSVLVQGIGRPLAGIEREWAATVPLHSWAIEDAEHLIAIDTDVIRGRRFGKPTVPGHRRRPT